MNNENTFNPYLQNLSLVKSYFKKPIILVLGILYAVSIGVSLIAGFKMGPVLSNIYQAMFSYADIYESMNYAEAQFMEMLMSDGVMSTYIISAMIPSLIIPALYVTAYFIIYFKSKNDSLSSTPQAGFTILFIMAILNLVATSFSALVMLLFFLTFVIAAIVLPQSPDMPSSDASIIAVVFVIAAIALAAICAIMLIYSISGLKYIKNARNSLKSVELSSKGAGTYGVLSLIYGIFTFISILPTLISGPIIDMMAHNLPFDFPIEIFSTMGDLYLISGLASLVSVSVVIVDGIVALGYKKHIKNITSGYYIPQESYTAPAQPMPVYSETIPTQKCCPQCSAPANENDVFCKGCGTKLQ